MNIKYITKKIILLGLVFVLLLSTAACGSSDTADTDDTAAGSDETDTADSDYDGEVETVYYAFTTNSLNSYIDEDGNYAGYEFDVVNAIFDLLPQYELEYVATSDEDLLVGLESGKYDIATKGAWWTEEREETFVFPEHYIGTSIIGLTYRTEDSEYIYDMESFAAYSGNLVPISPQNAQYSIIEYYNETHPDAQVTLTAMDNFTATDAYQWVLEGRYDGYMDILSVYESTVVAEDGEYHAYADQLSYVIYEAIPTWAFFSADNQEMADAFDEAWETLYETGLFEELAYEYFGYSLFEYVPEGYQKGDQL